MRSILALLVGIAVGTFVGIFLGLAAGLLSGWATFAIVTVIWLLLIVWPMDGAQTRSHARTEDPGRRPARLIALVGSIASLGAVAVVLTQTRNAPDPIAFLLAGISVLSVAASWGLIQVDYMLRVAAVYYADPVGGINFNQDEDPMYTDFAYFSVGLGMTYQVSDTNITRNDIRRIVIAQTMLAYLFGAVILATVINLVTQLG